MRARWQRKGACCVTRTGRSSLAGLRPEIFQISLPDGFNTAALDLLQTLQERVSIGIVWKLIYCRYRYLFVVTPAKAGVQRHFLYLTQPLKTLDSGVRRNDYVKV